MSAVTVISTAPAGAVARAMLYVSVDPASEISVLLFVSDHCYAGSGGRHLADRQAAQNQIGGPVVGRHTDRDLIIAIWGYNVRIRLQRPRAVTHLTVDIQVAVAQQLCELYGGAVARDRDRLVVEKSREAFQPETRRLRIPHWNSDRSRRP